MNVDRVEDDALHRAINERNLTKCRALLSCTDALRLARHVERGEIALSLACRRGAPLEIVKLIHSVDPSLISHEHYRGSTPLYFACDRASQEVMEFLVSRAPRMALASNRDGKVPLHWAVIYRRAPSFIIKLLAGNPAAVKASSASIGTPLHFFMRSGRSYLSIADFVRILSLMVKASVRGRLDDEDEEWLFVHEMLKIHCVVSIVSQTLLAILENADSSQCTRPGGGGDFPLHLACAMRPIQTIPKRRRL